MTENFSNNTAKGRFEYQVGDAIAFANYRNKEGTVFIDYVEAPPKLRGTGAVGKLMQHVMDQIRKDGLKVVPICGYAVSWLLRHKEYDDLQG